MYPVAVSLAQLASAPAAPPKGKQTTAVTRAAQRDSAKGPKALKNALAFTNSGNPKVSWAPGGVSQSPAKKVVTLKLPIPKQKLAFVLPQLPAKSRGGYKFGKVGFQPLAPMMVVPHAVGVPALKIAPKTVPAAAAPAPIVAAAPRPPAQPDTSYPLTELSEEQPLKGVNRSVASVIQELATREKIRVVIGQTGDKTITLRLGEVEPELALKRVASISGLALRKHEGVWYVATPDWMTQAFPERQYSQLIQLPTEDANVLASALQKVLGGGAKVEAVGGNNLIVRAPVSELEAAAYILAQWPVDETTKNGPVASLALNLTDGLNESMFRLAGMDENYLQVEKTDRTDSIILRGSPSAVLGGLKTYVAAAERALLPSASVARRADK